MKISKTHHRTKRGVIKRNPRRKKKQTDRYGKTIRWKSIYEAPIELIVREFKQAYGRKPTEEELNDILLEGSW